MNTDQYRRRFGKQARDGHYAAAARTLDAWSRRQPSAFEPCFHQVRLHLLNGGYRNAHDAAERLAARHDCPPGLALELALCLKSFSLRDRLIDWASQYAQLQAIATRDMARVATTLSAVGAHQAALDRANQALAKSPSDPVCLVNQALILSNLGEFARSRANLEHVIASSKHKAMAHWLLARLPDQGVESH